VLQSGRRGVRRDQRDGASAMVACRHGEGRRTGVEVEGRGPPPGEPGPSDGDLIRRVASQCSRVRGAVPPVRPTSLRLALRASATGCARGRRPGDVRSRLAIRSNYKPDVSGWPWLYASLETRSVDRPRAERAAERDTDTAAESRPGASQEAYVSWRVHARSRTAAQGARR